MKVLPIRPARPAPSVPAAPADARWRWARLLTAPHRLGFFSAAVLLAVGALWWALVLATRAAGIALPWAVPPPVAHGLLMGLGAMPLFIVGFLFTAGPRWLGLPDVPAPVLRRPVVLMLAGWALALAGFHLATEVAAAGLGLVALGWGALVWRFLRLLRASRVADRLHATLVALGCGVGVGALVLATLGLALPMVQLTRAATQLALWCFLAATFAVVSHRMIPFFTASALPALAAWRPNALLWTLLGLLWLEGAGAAAEAWLGTLPTGLRWAQALVEAPAALLLLGVAWRWGLVQSLRIRLLAMLHAGFLWLGIALALAASSHAALAASEGAWSLGLAPTHALTMGYLGTTLIAMITRVAAGHSGRALAADNLAWSLYWAVCAATVLRVAAAIWPDATDVLTLGAVALWCVACVGWAWRYGGWLGRPRIDGRPG